MSKLTMDIHFDFENDTSMLDGILGNGGNGICKACNRRYKHHDVPVPLWGYRCEGYGEKYEEEGVFYFNGVLCGDCLLSSPSELAAKIRTRAGEILRKPNTRRKQRVEAEGMIEFAGELEKVGDLRDLPGGIMAVKIGEAYRELDNRPKAGQAREVA